MKRAILIAGVLIFFLICSGIVYVLTVGFPSSSIQDESLNTVRKIETLTPGKLVVVTNIPFEPMEFLDENGNLVGLDIDIIKTIAKYLDLEVVIQKKDWDEMFSLVKQNKVDAAISSITVTNERSQEFNFSVPYFDAGQVVVVLKKNEKEFSDLGNLQKKKVFVQKNTTGELVAKEVRANVLERDVIGDAEAQELISGAGDALIIDFVVASQFVKKYPEISIVGPQVTKEFYAIMFSNSKHTLLQEINDVLRNMRRSGELDRIKKRWIQE